MATTQPGTRIMQQVLSGDVGRLVTTLEGNFKTLSTVGEDSVLLNLASPHTYVARGDCTVFTIESSKFGKVLSGLGE
jgi:CRP-like cAMP-binding protein